MNDGLPKRVALLLSVGALLLSCGGDSLGLDEAAEDPEFDEIRARLPLTVSAGGNAACDPTQCTADSFALQRFFECQASRGAERATTGCGVGVRGAEASICAANTLLAVIEAPQPQEFRIRLGLQGESLPVTIGPQDAESNAVLAALAMEYAGDAVQSAGLALTDPGVCPSGTGTGALGAPAGTGVYASTTLAEELAQFFVEALELARQAGEHAGDAGSAVSDAAYSRRTDSASASRDTLADLASRTAAAHALVGGADGLPALRGVSQNGFFTRSRLTAEGQRALQLLRIAAVSPDLVNGSVPIDDMVAGTGSVDAKDSVRFRLAKMRHDALLLAATTASSVYESLGVSREGFSEARELLREEIRAFDRSPTEPLPAEPLPDGSNTSAHDITLYAATRNPPEQLPASYWSALLRYDPTPLSVAATTLPSFPTWTWLPDANGAMPPGYTYGIESSASAEPPRANGTRTLASILDEVVARGPTITARLCPMGACTSPADPLGRARDAVVGALAAFAGNPALDSAAATPSTYDVSSYVGRARLCWYHTTAYDDAYLNLTGVDASEVRVVTGRDGLECAVRGTIEGVPCTTSRLDSLTPPSPAPSPGQNWRWILNVHQRVSNRPNDNTVSLFVVRQRPTGGAVPGNYEELTGWILPAISGGSVGWRYCQGAVLAPELDRAAAHLIQPSTEAPYRPAESCAGLPSDMRIPLENELTDDGNGIESSWQHYLRLAQTASNEADLLGEDLVRTGMEMDARAEAASDELSRLCGVSINLTSIASAIAADTSPASMPATGGQCASPYVLRGDQCVRDPILYALQRANAGDDYARLASCVGTDTVPWASLGNTPVCAWDANGSAPGGLCDGATPDMPCPVANSAGTNCAGMRKPAGATIIPVPDFIGIFARPLEPEPTPPDPNDLPCAELSRRRAGETLTSEERRRLRRLLTHDAISNLAQQVTWEALVGDYSAVRYANATVFRTGSMSQPPTTTSLWPMGPPPVVSAPMAMPMVTACPTGATSSTEPSNYTGPLFCLQNLASLTGDPGRLARSRMNDLLARAVLAIRIFSGNGLGQTVLPYYNDNWADCYFVDPSTFAWGRLGTSNGWCSPVGDFLVDHRVEGDNAAANTRTVPDYGSRACFVGTSDAAMPVMCPTPFGPGMPAGQSTSCTNTIPAGAEWSLCPYDQPDCVEVFDDALDCDDGTGLPAGQWPNWDHNLPLVLRPADAGLGASNGYVAAAELWRTGGILWRLLYNSPGRTGSELRTPLHLLYSDVHLEDLTNYYQSWSDRGFGPYVHHQEGDYIAATEDPVLRLLGEGNRAFIGRGGLTYNDLLNGVELACVAARYSVPPEFPQCQAPGPIETLTDVFRTEGYLECQANAISQRGADTMVSGLPRRVVDALRESTAGAGGAGEFDAQIAEIRAGLIELSTTRETLGADLRSFASRVRALRSAVAVNERGREIEDLMRLGREADRITQCVTALATIAGEDLWAAGGRAVAAAATCVNTGVQMQIEADVARLREANLDEELIQQFATFDGDLAQYSGKFAENSIAQRAAIERINAALARLRSTQVQARRALARALLLESDGAGAHFRLDTTYRARYSTQLTRYRNAHRRAVRSAYIARIALEQRLGMPLADIEDDLYADEAPREWVDEICTLPSIDYDTLGQEMGEGAVPADYSGTYVGDYVRRLENVFESYSFVHPFREGTDTAVISLRDDVFRTRAPCESETPSLLYHGGALSSYAGEGRPGWTLLGCNPALVTTGLDRSCLEVRPLEATTGTMAPDVLPAMPTSVVGADFGRPAPYRLTFGGTAAATSGTRLEQALDLPRGRYRVSWWAKVGPSNTTQPSTAVAMWNAAGTNIQEGSVWPSTLPSASQWNRYWAFADHVGGALRVVIPYGGTGIRDIDIAGVMLEDVSGIVVGSLTGTESIPNPGGSPTMVIRGDRASPPPFFEGGETGLRTLRTCRDDYGIFFQREAWEQGCVRVCRDGYDGSCAPGDATETRCYRQTSFDISSDALQQMLIRGDAGFAAGNFNYRIESVAVNLVGTGLRDCGGRGDTSGCYANGSFSFSMLHLGPYLVRNALGSLYEAPLFPGRLESARSVAAERYITNPISSADQALIGPYTRGELQGRPLGGGLVLRLWDDPAFRFDRLEDVQVVLTYRYWQHQR